ELKDPLEHLHRDPQPPCTGEWPVELDALPSRRARKLDPWELLAIANLEVRERLVVLEIAVKARLNVLDQPGFHQEGVDVTVGGNEIDVDDVFDEFRRAML